MNNIGMSHHLSRASNGVDMINDGANVGDEDEDVHETSDEFGSQCLQAHNRYRREHGVVELIWSSQLAYMAASWAKRLAAKNFLSYSELTGIGENITFFPANFNGNQVTDYWMKERNRYEYETPGWQAGTNYFTQIVWKATKEMGVSTRNIEGTNQMVVVAFYRPSGNCNRNGEFANNVFKPKHPSSCTRNSQDRFKCFQMDSFFHSNMNIARFGISPTFGFVLDHSDNGDAISLPRYFECWERLSDNLSSLISERRVWAAVDQLPQLGIDRLTSHRQMRLAHLRLTSILSAYCCCAPTIDRLGGSIEIPSCIGRPLWEVSERLSLQPWVIHASCALFNYRPLDPRLSATDANNRQLITFDFAPKSNCTDWFFINTQQVEIAFAHCLQLVVEQCLVQPHRDQQQSKLIETLVAISSALTSATQSLMAFRSRLDPDDFYNYLRPYLSGCDAVTFKGVDDPGPHCFQGATAAQSPTLQVIDAFLGLCHSNTSKKFLVEQRRYMLQEHRAFIEFVELTSPFNHRSSAAEVNSSLPIDVAISTEQEQLINQQRQECCSALKRFRRAHLNLAVQYVTVPSKSKQQRHTTLMNGTADDEQGTGGTNYSTFLNDVISHIR